MNNKLTENNIKKIPFNNSKIILFSNAQKKKWQKLENFT